MQHQTAPDSCAARTVPCVSGSHEARRSQGRIRAALLAAWLAAAGGPAAAQEGMTCAKDLFTYGAPSGTFGEGTAKWQMMRFIRESHEAMMGICGSTSAQSVQPGSTSTDARRQAGVPSSGGACR